MPLIIPANTLSDSDYEIDNSLRVGSGRKLSRTFTAVTAERKKHTISCWVKLCILDGENHMLFAGSSDSTYIRFDDTHTIRFRFFASSADQSYLQTNRLFRDPNAWYHVVLVYDSAQGTASNRVKIYVNGVQETSFSTETYPDQDEESIIGNNVAHTIQGYSSGGEFYVADWYYIGNQALSPSDFGETNDNGVWIPKKYTGGFGSTNDTFLEFKQTGTGTDASGIGADTSGQNNHMASTNLAATDVTTDTPTNNFATINALANYYNPATLSEGNTRVDFANDVSTSYVISTIGVASGKWYCEVKGVDIPSYGEIGIASRPRQDDGNDDKLTVNVNNYGYTANNGNVKSNGTAGSSYGNSYSDGDMIGIAMDLDNNKLYFSKNGTWQNSGDPTSGSTGTGAFSIAEATTTHDGFYYFAGGSNINNDNTRMDFNFGNPSFSISSGNADANGYGNFEYAVPSGYYALCTKNLAEYG
tara:strand:+ start:871 stop:2289 length:1419 start_codon:yes stop_codon:yes gene_type:complete